MALNAPKTSRGAESTPTEEQTTVRVSKQVQEKLKLISAIDGRTQFDIVDGVLRDYIRRFEQAIGRPLAPSSRTKTPKV